MSSAATARSMVAGSAVATPFGLLKVVAQAPMELDRPLWRLLPGRFCWLVLEALSGQQQVLASFILDWKRCPRKHS